MGGVSIPQNYDVTLHGSTDVGLDDIRIQSIPPITLNSALTSLPTIKTESKITDLPTIKTESSLTAQTTSAVGLDVRIKELPKIQLEVSLKPTRVHLPLKYDFCLSLLGLPLLKFSACGESMLITEDYVPKATEHCS